LKKSILPLHNKIETLFGPIFDVVKNTGGVSVFLELPLHLLV